MDNKTKIISILQKIGLDKDQFAVFGSGPMCVRGWRDFHDLDLLVKEGVFEQLRKDNEVAVAGSGDECIKKIVDGVEIEFFYGWHPGEWDAKMLIERADIIDGYRFVRLEDVVKWKKIKGREKDWNDIKIIEEKIKQ